MSTSANRYANYDIPFDMFTEDSEDQAMIQRLIDLRY